MSTIFLTNKTDFSKVQDSIALQTSKRRDIPNYQIKALSAYEINLFDLYIKDYPFLKFKGQATPLYNCHGFTFASRRTNINDSQALRNILQDDEYIQVSQRDIMPGDVVLWVDDNGSIEHTGMIAHVEGDGINTMRHVWVISKWGKYKEVSHLLDECKDYRSFKKEFWRNNHGYTREK